MASLSILSNSCCYLPPVSFPFFHLQTNLSDWVLRDLDTQASSRYNQSVYSIQIQKTTITQAGMSTGRQGRHRTTQDFKIKKQVMKTRTKPVQNPHLTGSNMDLKLVSQVLQVH